MGRSRLSFSLQTFFRPYEAKNRLNFALPALHRMATGGVCLCGGVALFCAGVMGKKSRRPRQKSAKQTYRPDPDIVKLVDGLLKGEAPLEGPPAPRLAFALQRAWKRQNENRQRRRRSSGTISSKYESIWTSSKRSKGQKRKMVRKNVEIVVAKFECKRRTR